MLTHANVKLKPTRHEKKRAHECALLHGDLFLPHHIPETNTTCQAMLHMRNKRNDEASLARCTHENTSDNPHNAFLYYKLQHAYHHGYWATNSSKPWPSMHLNWLDWCLGACSSLPDGGCSLQSTHMLFLSAKEVALAFVSPVCFCQSLCQLRPERSKILMDSRR